jgi:hypothetical protein
VLRRSIEPTPQAGHSRFVDKRLLSREAVVRG